MTEQFVVFFITEKDIFCYPGPAGWVPHALLERNVSGHITITCQKSIS